MIPEETVIDQMIEYYRARAPEYDEWFLREGRYDRGEAFRQRWFAEIHRLEVALREQAPLGDALELACGTGLWTQHLATMSDSLLAVDAAPEVLKLNRQRLASDACQYELADLFRWQPKRTYDFVFFSFWLSHVPATRFNSFWELVRAALKPEGRVFFIDSLFNPDTPAANHKEIGREGSSERILNDGSRFEIVKIFYVPTTLEQQLEGLGWNGDVLTTGEFFLYGSLSPVAR